MSGVTYSKPDKEMEKLLAYTIGQWHKRLTEAEVTITLLAAYGPVNDDGETVGPAIKHHGVPALGVVKITNLKYRVAGLGDAEIVIDGDAWAEMTKRERIALLDHELTHIEIVHESVFRKKAPDKPLKVEISANGIKTTTLKVADEGDELPQSKPILDDAGRPKLRLRHHDRSFGWFDEVAKRHGDESHEVRQAKQFADEAGQLYFAGRGWGEVGS